MKEIILHTVEEENIEPLEVYKSEFLKEYPKTNQANIETIIIGRNIATFVNREKYINIIVCNEEIQFTINKNIDDELKYNAHSVNFLVGHCKFSMKPIAENAIEFNDQISTGEMYQNALLKYGTNLENIKRYKDIQKLTFHYIAETIYQFCKEMSISKIAFTVKDLKYDAIDVSPTKYGIFMNYKLKEMFYNKIFRKVKN